MGMAGGVRTVTARKGKMGIGNSEVGSGKFESGRRSVKCESPMRISFYYISNNPCVEFCALTECGLSLK